MSLSYLNLRLFVRPTVLCLYDAITYLTKTKWDALLSRGFNSTVLLEFSLFHNKEMMINIEHLSPQNLVNGEDFGFSAY